MQTLWTLSTHADLQKARQNLQKREKTPTIDSIHFVVTGTGKSNSQSKSIVEAITRWVQALPQDNRPDAIIWTGLGAKFGERPEGEAPTQEEAVAYLWSLTGTSLTLADEYVRKAPLQIRTPIRDAIEQEFGWHYVKELEQRRDIAKKVDDAFTGHPSVIATFAFGSVASGRVDEHSDVDIGIVCDPVVPTEPERLELLSRIGTGWIIPYPTDEIPGRDVWESWDRGTVDDISVEVHFLLASKVSTVLDQMINQGSITTQEVSFRPYTIGSMVQRARVLRDGCHVFEKWFEQTRFYPKLLKQNILKYHAPLLREAVVELTRSAERRTGPGMILFFLVRGMHALDSIVFALNDKYDPADRRDEKTVIPYLPKVPKGFIDRYRYVLEGPFDEAGALDRARAFEQLTNEVIALVEPELV